MAIIALCCPNLRELTFSSNCEFDFIGGFGDLNNDVDDEEYDRGQRFLQMAKEASEIMTSFSNLETVSFQSPCNRLYLSFVLTRCPRWVQFEFGAKQGNG